MSVEDQARYGAVPDIAARLDPQPSSKIGASERKEQSTFANWCLSKGYPFVWHSTPKRTTCNLGTPDFWVGVAHHGFVV
jgi:hypothetical protein